MGCKRLKVTFFILLLNAGCSRGGLYDGDDSFGYDYSPIVSTGAPDDQSFGLAGSYSSVNRLYFGTGSNYSDIMIFSPPLGYLPSDEESSEDVLEANDESMKQVSRHFIRRSEPIDLQNLILQPVGEFNPLKDAECILTLTGSLQREDQCEGASKCKLYRVDNIYTDEENETCGFPTIKSFVVKFDRKLQKAEVLDPIAENWIATEQVNYFAAESTAIRISPESDLFSSVVATTTAKGFVFAGKRYKKDIVSASFPDRVSTTVIRQVDLEGVSTDPYFEKAQTRNVLLAATSKGIFKLNSQDKWEVLPLPSGLSAMPPDAEKVFPVSGVGLAAFRFLFSDAEKNLVITYKEATNTLEVVDLSTLALEPSASEGTVPSGWALMIVNENLWFWNQSAPMLSKKFDFNEKKWQPVVIALPEMPEAGASPKYQLLPAGQGFVLTVGFTTKIKVDFAFAAEDIEIEKKAFRHFFYDADEKAQGTPINTFAAPDAMHVLNGKAYFERVVGVDRQGGRKIMDYGFVYDFIKGTGKMFSDSKFKAALSNSSRERLAESAGIIVNDQSVLFYGGCEKPDDVQQCIDVAIPLARLVKFSPL